MYVRSDGLLVTLSATLPHTTTPYQIVTHHRTTNFSHPQLEQQTVHCVLHTAEMYRALSYPHPWVSGGVINPTASACGGRRVVLKSR